MFGFKFFTLFEMKDDAVKLLCSVYDAIERGKDAEFDAKLAQQGLCGAHKIWLGKDYVNFIFKDFVELDNPFTGFDFAISSKRSVET